MATPKEKDEALKVAKAQLEKLSKVESSALARTEELSRDINFSEAVPYFEKMIDRIKVLNQSDISTLSKNQLDKIIYSCDLLNGHINQVLKFNINQNIPGDACLNLITTIQDSYDIFLDHLILPICYTSIQDTNDNKFTTLFENLHNAMQLKSESYSKTLQDYQNQAEQALNAIKNQAAESAVSHHSIIFQSNADTHAGIANKWLKATITLSILTFLVSLIFYLFCFLYVPDSAKASIQLITSKVIILSILSFGIFWCSKNYKSNKHNETLNRHRANALLTFNTFVEGSDNQIIKDAILLQVSQAAFSNRTTGYENQEKDVQTINPVVEILGNSIAKSN